MEPQPQTKKRVEFSLQKTWRGSVVRCRSCGEEMVWRTTLEGKSMPLDVKSLRMADDADYMESHFAHCKSWWHRKRR